MRKRVTIAIVAGIAAVGLVVGALVFQPWLLFVDVAVDEALPVISETPEATPDPTSTATPAPPAGPVQLSAGELISHEHETTGTVRIIENADGSRVLSLENLSTSSGPDVHVWLSNAAVVPGYDGWFLAADASYLDLGPIKGNLGNQVYEIPADADLGQFPSVYLWCVQFAVSFGAAPLA